MRSRRWLTLGIGVKRYILLIFAGTVILALALAMFLAYVYRTIDVPGSEPVPLDRGPPPVCVASRALWRGASAGRSCSPWWPGPAGPPRLPPPRSV